MAAAGAYPVRVDASLDTPLSRWLWLVKWLLLIPHYIVLAFLWFAFLLVSVVAFVVILFTGSYPLELFEFNVGVLRWTWRVQYYAIGAFGTDRYPPFTLADDPSYPAHLEIDYPHHLSRGLVLVKWWLLAIPHYIVIALFTGAGLWSAAGFEHQAANWSGNWGGWGLIGILAIIAAVVLLFTGRYPDQIFDFLLGMNRWVLRVAAYAGLMTDEYPPFRLDLGGHDPGTVALQRTPAGWPPAAGPPAGGPVSGPPPGGPAPGPPRPGRPAGGEGPGGQAAESAPAGGEPAGGEPAGELAAGRGEREAIEPSGQEPPKAVTPPTAPPPLTAGAPPPPGARPGGWTGGRIASAIIGAVLVLISLGLLGTGAAALWGVSQRDSHGYVDLGTATLRTSGHALASDTVSLGAAGSGWDAASGFFGTVRIRASAAGGTVPVFAGVAPAFDANRYLAGTSFATVRGIDRGQGRYTEHPGGAPAVPPSRAGIWTAQASGPGTQTMYWPVTGGDWTIVVMNASGSAPVSAQVSVAATLPWLPGVAAGLLIGGFVVLAAGIVAIVIPAQRAARARQVMS